jgi:hypothetical protein
VGKDIFDGAVCLRLADSRCMDEVLWFLGECWKDLGRPEQVQFDNARELCGWGASARTLSRVIRLCLRYGVSPEWHFRLKPLVFQSFSREKRPLCAVGPLTALRPALTSPDSPHSCS